MINVSNAYRDACVANERTSYVVARFGLYDKQAKADISKASSDNIQEFSNIDKTYNEIKETNFNYITCEPNRVKLDGSFCWVQDKTKINANESIAYWSKELSNENGYFENNPRIVYSFSSEINFTDVTLYFQEVCSEFKVVYRLNGQNVTTRNVSGNQQTQVTTTGTYSEELKFNELEIEFIKTRESYRYIKFNEIDFGIYRTFTRDQITSFDIIDELSIDSTELSANSLTLNIDNSNGRYDILNPANELNLLQEKQEISMYHNLKVNNKFVEVPLGTFLLKTFKVTKNNLTIECYDSVYFMNKTYYGGRFYENENLTTILKELFAYFNYTKYMIDDELNDIKLTGYVLNREFRECLRSICEAAGCVVNQNRYGVTYIFKTYDPSVKKFKRREIFTENPVRNLFNNVIDVTEYDYTNRLEETEIFNSTLSVGTHTLVFSLMPILDVTIEKMEENEDYEIVERYATTCTVNVTKETSVKIKGTYVNQTSSVKRILKNNVLEVDDYAVTSVNNTLITSENSDSIGEWKLNRSDVQLNFTTLAMPYIEVGDTCKYDTQFKETRTFIPTRLEFSKSIKQLVEGE